MDAAIGGIAGLSSGLLGVGGGFVMAPLQAIWARWEQLRVSGTSLAAVISISLVGAAVYYIGRGVPQGDVLFGLFGLFLVVAALYVWRRRKELASQPA